MLKGKNRFWMILLIIISSFGLNNFIVLAEPSPVVSKAYWSYPQEGQFYNPKATGPEANFAKIPFRIRILDDLIEASDPLFKPNNKKPSSVLLRLTKDGTDGYYAPNINDVTITDNIQLDFVIDSAIDTLVDGQSLGTFLTDGTWQYELSICMNGIDTQCAGGELYQSAPRTLKIDTTPPDVSFKYDEGSTQEPHMPQVRAITWGTSWTGVKPTTFVVNSLYALIKDFKDNILPQIVPVEMNPEELRAKQVAEYELFQKSREKDQLIEKLTQIDDRIETTKNAIEAFNEIDIENNLIQSVQLSGFQEELLGQNHGKDTVSLSPNTSVETLLEVSNPNYGLMEQAELIRQRLYGPTGEVGNQSGLIGAIESLEQTVTAPQVTLSVPPSFVPLEGKSLPAIIINKMEAVKAIKATSKNKTDHVDLEISCDDQGGSGCGQAIYHLEINGNFCDDATVCDTTGTRKIKICDKVGNCIDPETHQNIIDWYDAVAPGVTLPTRPSSTVSTGTPLQFDLSNGLSETDFDKIDLRRKDSLSTEGRTLNDDFNEDACGANSDSPLVAKGDVCLEKQQVCITDNMKQGTIDNEVGGSCVANCPDGYIENETGICVLACSRSRLSFCLPFKTDGASCLRDASSWMPKTGTKPFIQTNNCGDQRQAP